MKVIANGIVQHYEITGQGKDLTLVHGMGDNLRAWEAQVAAFSPQHRLLTYDVRGHGETEMPAGEFSRDVWQADLEGLHQVLGISETALLGYSMGAGVVLQYAIDHPDRVWALVLSNGGLGRPVAAPVSEEMRQSARGGEEARAQQLRDIEERGMIAVAERYTSSIFSPGFAESHPEVVRRYQAVVAANDAQKYLRIMRGMGAMFGGPQLDLRRIQCPTLIIVGEHDQGANPERAREAQRQIKGAVVKVFPTGHAAYLEQPEAYNETVLEFLARAVS